MIFNYIVFFFSLNRQVLHVMADLHGMDPDTLADIVYKNTTKVFFPDCAEDSVSV